MSTKTTTATDKKSSLYNINGTLLGDVEIRQAHTKNGEKPYAYAKVQAKNEKVITIMTFVTSGIKALTGKTAGTAVRLYGTFTKAPKGRTFSAMGISPDRPVKAEAAA